MGSFSPPNPDSALVLLLAGLLVAGCVSSTPAPVVDRTGQPKAGVAAKPPAAAQSQRPPAGPAEFYTVRRGDTLYSIALDHGLDYRELALWNGIDKPGAIQVGQQLRVTAPRTTTAAPLKSAPGVEARPLGGAAGSASASDAIKTQPQGVRVPYSDQSYAQLAGIKPEAAAPSRAEAPADADGEEVQFGWPTSGKIINSFYDGAKGIGISGKPGQPVYASAPGRVIFSGTGIRGFGKLIVIKHNNTFLSVYGHNNELLVREGQSVTRGQKIAEMGDTDSDQVKLHFEIRRFGKPVDPLKLLPERQG